MPQKSIWIGDHAVKQYASRVEQTDPANLTKEDRIRITKHLLSLYQRSKELTESDRVRLKIPSKTKLGQNRYFCTLMQGGKRITVVLVCAFDDAHRSQAYKLVTVYKVKEISLKSLDRNTI